MLKIYYLQLERYVYTYVYEPKHKFCNRIIAYSYRTLAIEGIPHRHAFAISICTYMCARRRRASRNLCLSLGILSRIHESVGIVHARHRENCQIVMNR